MSAIARSVKLAAALLLAGVSPGLAASPVTQAFLAHVAPNVDFLDRSSRFALENSKSGRLKAFAWSQAREQTLAANALYDWTQADKTPLVATTAPAPALDKTPTASTRSAPSPAGEASAAPSPQQADAPLPLGQEDLDSLEGLEGKDFDDQYKDKQRDALRQIEADYTTYIATGDDPTLKALATSELPKVRAKLVALGRL